MDSLFLFLLFFGTRSKNGKIGGAIFIWSFLLLETEQLSPNFFLLFPLLVHLDQCIDC